MEHNDKPDKFTITITFLTVGILVAMAVIGMSTLIFNAAYAFDKNTFAGNDFDNYWNSFAPVAILEFITVVIITLVLYFRTMRNLNK